MEPNVGLSNENRTKIAGALSKFLADTFALYVKTLNFHWNVKGPDFRDLHLAFEDQYTELAGAIDAIAERITILGFTAPGTFREFSQLASVKDASGTPDATGMVKELLADNETVIRTARDMLGMASSAGDEATVNLISDRMSAHEKAAWMLRSRLN